MQPVSAETTRLTNDGLALRIGGRTYGETEGGTLADLKTMMVPRELDALRDALFARSQLLQLQTASTHTDVSTRYGNDLIMLNSYRAALRACVTAAVEARAESNQTDSQAFLKTINDSISPIEFQPTLRLAVEELKMEPQAMLAKLQAQFRTDVDSFAHNVTLWLHVLAERDVVSVIEWFNTSALRYHFFRMEDKRTGLGKTVDRTGNIRDGHTTTTTEKMQVDTYAERRVHTVVDAKAHSPENYKAKVPARIAKLVDSIPPELRQFVTIIDGHVSQEEIHRRKTTSRVDVETKSVYTPDPAVALFNTWAIGGWGGSTPEASRSVYRGHASERANKELVAWGIGTAVVAFGATLVAGSRGALMVAAVGVILGGLRQLGIRLDNK